MSVGHPRLELELLPAVRARAGYEDSLLELSESGALQRVRLSC